MKRADVKIWFACNNHCRFCVQWDKRLHYKQRTVDEIKEILDREFANWCRWLVFTWWEPTVHEWLEESLKYAKKLWFIDIQIQSNWRNFSDMEFLKRLIEAWATEFSPAIHGYSELVHDDLVWAPWAWKQVIEWIKNLKRLNQLIIINCVITKQNYQELPKLALLLCKLGVQQFQFAFVHILWSADKNKYDVVAKKTDVMPFVKKALDIGRSYWAVCMTEAIPFCMMEWYEWAIAEYNFMPETTVVDAEYRTESYFEYRIKDWKAKRGECNKCIRNNICEWPWKEYVELYWWEEFQPILDEGNSWKDAWIWIPGIS